MDTGERQLRPPAGNACSVKKSCQAELSSSADRDTKLVDEGNRVHLCS